MNDDPMEGTSELFASLLSDVSAEQWESFRNQQNELGMYVVDHDSDGESLYSDNRDEEFIAQVEVVEQEDNLENDMVSNEDDIDSESLWGCNAALKYAKGEITFSELNMMDSDQPKTRRKRQKAAEKDTEPREETQHEKEFREYQAFQKNGRKKVRRKMNQVPKDLEYLMGAANRKLADGCYDDAIKMCMELIRLAPSAHDPYHTLGYIFDELGQHQKALEYYLVAAFLNPSDTDQWIRLAELSYDRDQIPQAISCYSRAIRNQPANVDLIWKQCELYERIRNGKKALAGYELILNQLNNPDDAEKCVKWSIEIAKAHQENSDFVKAIRLREMACAKYPSLIETDDVSDLLELQLNEKMHKNAVKISVQFCGVSLQMPDKIISSFEDIDNLTDEDFALVESCFLPEDLRIDIRVNILICLIYLKSIKAVEPLLETFKSHSFKSEKPSEITDFFFKVADSLMEVGEYALAKDILMKLLDTPNCDKAAAWMKYADCLSTLSSLEEAVKAYEKVILMAPSYQEARLALSKIYLSQGKVDEATNILRQEYTEGEEMVLGTNALFERCKLLESGGKWDEYITSATLLQYSHCYMLKTEEEFSAVLTNQTSRRRNEALRDLKDQHKRSVPEFVGKPVPLPEMYDIFKKVSNKLMEMERFEELMTLSLAALTSTMFMKCLELRKEVEFQALLSCFFNKSYYCAYILGKDLVLKNINNTAAWNLFCLIVTYSQENRHNRFCLRLMMKHQDHLALGFLNGHNAMISGTYKHALGEYMCIMKEKPNDPFATFCVGIAFIHMASQKFATKRHFLIMQGFAFLIKYLHLKGECQETYYNVGRALHQLGIKDVALHYYKRALDAPLLITGSDEETFDLRREIAYNISLIYQSTGAMDLAYMYLRKNIII